jgi:hypothetical protein
MKEAFCEKEEQLVAALCGSSRDAAILDHARICPVCSEVLLVAGFLRESTQIAAHELRAVPDAALIWRRAQALAREKAVVSATLPIRLARISALVVVVLAASWLLPTSHQLWHWMGDLWSTHLWSANLLGPSHLRVTALVLAITGTLVCSLSAWYMLQEE